MNIAIFGAIGRVGSAVLRIAEERGHNVVPIEKNTQTEVLSSVQIDIVIDFSTAEATEKVCEFCLDHNAPLVTGVTGRKESEQAALQKLSEKLPVIAEANFAEGVQILVSIVEKLAKALPNWDCEIVEIHHRGKKDAPSGTAKKLAAAAAKRKSFGKVTVHSLRCGSNFGQHSIVFATEGESLTLTHQAENVDIFARGAVIKAEKLYLAAQNISDGERVGTVDGD